MMRLRLAGVAFMYSPSLFKLIFGADIESLSKLTKVVEQCGAKRHVARTKGSATLERGTQKT